MIKILVVDDEQDLEHLIKQKFRKEIRENKYDFSFALNGNQALQILQDEKNIDLVLSDINMPEMDGLTLLLKVKDLSTLTKTVMVSAYGDMDNIRTAMNRGAFDFVCKPINFEDLSLTIEKTVLHIRDLKRTMQAIKENNILKMYVDETVIKFMESREFEESLQDNEVMEATVAFIDICDFTAISETESADVVIHLLNEYFDIIVKEIINQNGIIDKFIGDAIMAVFKDEYHLDRALDACLAIRNAVKSIELPFGNKSFRPKVSIGVNAGQMVSGNIGCKTLKRFDYTVIGDVVNVAARLQGSAGKGQIFITDASHEKIKESFKCSLVGELELKNKSMPIKVFEVVE
ncbi:MAG: adenylate/guanylate cyclase domain-containing protein [Saprospiraceae bacterium]